MLDGQREVESLHSFPSSQNSQSPLQSWTIFSIKNSFIFLLPSYLGMNCCYSQDTQQRYGLLLGSPFLSVFWKDPAQLFEVLLVLMSQRAGVACGWGWLGGMWDTLPTWGRKRCCWFCSQIASVSPGILSSQRDLIFHPA